MPEGGQWPVTEAQKILQTMEEKGILTGKGRRYSKRKKRITACGRKARDTKAKKKWLFRRQERKTGV